MFSVHQHCPNSTFLTHVVHVHMCSWKEGWLGELSSWGSYRCVSEASRFQSICYYPMVSSVAGLSSVGRVWGFWQNFSASPHEGRASDPKTHVYPWILLSLEISSLRLPFVLCPFNNSTDAYDIYPIVIFTGVNQKKETLHSFESNWKSILFICKGFFYSKVFYPFNLIQ